jgi:hypothetical protein
MLKMRAKTILEVEIKGTLVMGRLQHKRCRLERLVKTTIRSIIIPEPGIFLKRRIVINKRSNFF